jgi:hypothetical protein
MRNYVKAEDLGFVESKFIYGPFPQAMENLLKNIIVPEFKYISTDFYMDDVIDVKNNLLIKCRINVENQAIVNNKQSYAEYESMSFEKQFLKVYNQSLINITNKMTPVNTNFLNKVGLSENQFIINLISLDIYSNVKVYQEPGEIGDFTKEILIDLIINIEEISELHPGGLEMLYLKYKNLCVNNSRYNLNELREWVQDLGYILGSKDEMCQIIKTHYGF